jgi:hypothetical protein
LENDHEASHKHSEAPTEVNQEAQGLIPKNRTDPMTQQYQGNTVTMTRAAKQGDPNFDAAKDQVIVHNAADNSDKTVLRSDVKNIP